MCMIVVVERLNESSNGGYGREESVCARRRLPLSPFMMTHIRDPTHLSMSSVDC